jgi:hypothetical protein
VEGSNGKVEEIKCRATVLFVLAIYYLGDPIKMRWARSVAWMREEKQLQNSTCKTQQRFYVKELGVSGYVILKWILNNEDWLYWAQGSFRVAD